MVRTSGGNVVGALRGGNVGALRGDNVGARRGGNVGAQRGGNVGAFTWRQRDNRGWRINITDTFIGIISDASTRQPIGYIGDLERNY